MNVKQTHEFMKALNAIVEEKGIDKSIVVEAMEAAMANAYKKNEGISNVKAKVNGDTGEIKLYTYKTVVEEVTNPETEISLEDARKIVDDIQFADRIGHNACQLYKILKSDVITKQWIDYINSKLKNYENISCR